MSIVRPIDLSADGVLTVAHDTHVGTVALSALNALSESTSALTLVCPVCGAATGYPIGGGADAEAGQRLHIQHGVAVKREKVTDAIARVQAGAEREGEGRFRFKGAKTLKQVADLTDRAKAPPLEAQVDPQAVSKGAVFSLMPSERLTDG